VRATAWRTFVAAACAAAQGCGPQDPLEMTVAADSVVSFSMWKERASDRLGAAQMADFEEALQELRFRTMADGNATGSEAVEEATLAVIDGRTVRYVLELGLGWELSQLRIEHSQLDFSMRENAWLRIRKGDTDSAEYLYQLRQRQEARLKAADEKIAVLRRKLVALGLHPGNEEVAPTPQPPATTQPAAPLPKDSPPQRIGRGETQTPATT
jgi:hypothetical protein